MESIMKPVFLAALTGICISLPVLPVLAHHSFSAEFIEEDGELSGVILSGRFSNPHPRYTLQVTLPDGSKEEWQLQGASATVMSNGGWNAGFVSPGDEVRVQGSLGRDGSKRLLIRSLEKASGEVYPRRTGNAVAGDQIDATPGRDYGYGLRNASAPFDISGPWRNRYKFRQTVDDLDPKPTPFTEAGRALYEKTVHHDDYSLRCVAPGLPRIFGAPYEMDIIDAGSFYQIIYTEHNTPRRIYMDGRTPPADYPDRPMGYSVGHWEGETLVIETTRLAAGWLDGSGLPFMGGADTRLEERYTFSEDRLTMERVMTIHDGYYTAPLTRHRYSVRDNTAAAMLVEHDSCDPTSYYFDLLEAGELQQRLDELL
jgi:hypothetical protein